MPPGGNHHNCLKHEERSLLVQSFNTMASFSLTTSIVAILAFDLKAIDEEQDRMMNAKTTEIKKKTRFLGKLS